MCIRDRGNTSKEVNEEDNSEKDNEADIPWDFVE